MNAKDLEEQYVLPVYPRRDIVLVRGKEAKLYDEAGREYIDCASNVGVSNIGHGDERVAKAIYEQYLTLGNCYAMFYSPVRARLAEKLISLAPGRLQKVFFCNSGAEAVEGAIKFARASTGKTGIIAAMRGFHGKTFGALAATWGPEYQKPFEPMLAGITHVPYNNFAKLKESVTKDTAAVILEPVQGEGGVRVGDRPFSGPCGIFAIPKESSSSWMKSRPVLGEPAPSSPVSSLLSPISFAWPRLWPAASPWEPCFARRQ